MKKRKLSPAYSTAACAVRVIGGVEVWLAREDDGGEELKAYVGALLDVMTAPVERVEVGPGLVGLEANVLLVFRPETKRRSMCIDPRARL